MSTSLSQAALRPRAKSKAPPVTGSNAIAIEPIKSNVGFSLYLVYTAVHFLSLPNWFHFLRPLRPTVLLLAILGTWLFMHKSELRGRLQSDISRKLLALIAYIFLSLPFVEFPGSVLKNNLDLFIKAIVFFFFTVLLIDTDKRLRTFVAVFVGCQLIRIIDPVRLNITEGYLGSQTHLGDNEFMGRLSSAPWDIVNPNGFAFVIVTGFVFTHFLMLGSGRRWLQLVYLALLPVMVYGLVMTASRSGMIAFVVGLVAIFIHSKRKMLMIAMLVVGSIFAFNNMSDVQRERYLSLVESDVRGANTAQARIDGSMTEFRLWTEKPIFGWGLGTSAEARYHSTGKYKIAHNMYAEVLMELGAVGFLFFAAVLLAIWRNSMRSVREIRAAGILDGNQGSLGYYVRLGRTLQTWFVVCAVFSIAHYGLSEPYWYLFAGLTAAWARCAGIMKASMLASEESKTTAPEVVRNRR